MAFNPMDFMKMKQNMDEFQARHPRVMPFFQAAAAKAEAGTIIEMKVIGTDGQEIRSNIRLTQEDMDLLMSLRNMQM
ncbi:MAG: hypothetical protein Q4B15_02545 [Lachnospiraceae bacterium]|nr:hypothetical protein [Lachnospiraceae bacterium]